MKLSVEQSELVGLTMELDLKTREYKNLCKKLDDLKKVVSSENYERLVSLLNEFKQNQKELNAIILKLNKLKEQQT